MKNQKQLLEVVLLPIIAHENSFLIFLFLCFKRNAIPWNFLRLLIVTWEKLAAVLIWKPRENWRYADNEPVMICVSCIVQLGRSKQNNFHVPISESFCMLFLQSSLTAVIAIWLVEDNLRVTNKSRYVLKHLL